MKNLRDLDRYRLKAKHLQSPLPASEGAFVVDYLRVIACAGDGWDHVSVSLEDRCPTWDEMERIKRMFFKDTEIAMQLHVPPKDHINCHPYTLHLWRPHYVRIPMPPEIMV